MLLQSPTVVLQSDTSLRLLFSTVLTLAVCVCAKRQVFPSHAGLICLASQQLISSAGQRLHNRWPTGCQPAWPESVIDPCGAAACFTPVSPATRSLRQRQAQSPPTGFMNHSVHGLSYLCGCVATHLAAVPMDRPRPFLRLAWHSDIMETKDGWGWWNWEWAAY